VWVRLGRDTSIVPLIDGRRRDRLDEALGALDVQGSAEDLERTAPAVPRGAARVWL
jgi:aryl-alcohol dehydrogenase-like predicted oxidoreductase